jgi:hypothetical protein
MKRLLFAVIAAVVATPASAGDVSASISVSQPGFYGQINIGEFPHPAVIYAQPLLIQPPPRAVHVEPIYLHVPPGHEKHWSKHCAEYNACGRPVYFVREDWYENEYVPRQHHQDENGQGKGNDKGKGNDHGKGNDKGKSNDKGE